MDVFPLRPQSITPVQSAAQASQEQLAQARLFAAEVLQMQDGGSMVLGIGRERIAAASQAGLQVGQKVLVRVRGSGSSRVLEILTTGAPDEGADFTEVPEVLGEGHPFRLLAQGQGLGEMLGDLVDVLQARGANAPLQARELARALAEFAFAPGDSGAELAQHVARSGLSHEARALAHAFETMPGAALASAAEEIIAAAFAGLVPEEEIAPLRRALGEQLAQKLGDSTALEALIRRMTPGGARAEAALHDWLAPALEKIAGGRIAARIREEIVERLAVARLAPNLGKAVLRALLGDRALLADALEQDDATRESRSAPDLKQWMTDAIGRLESGPERQALSAAHDALEAEQFIALARAARGDGSTYMLALREGSAFADARLVHRRLEEREPGERGARQRRGERAIFGFGFSRTGPVRAELGLFADALHVRLGVSNTEVAERLTATMGDLRARLESTGRSVHISIGVRAPEDLRVPGPELDERLGEGRAAVDRLG